MKIDYEALGKRIQKFRQARNYTQEYMAEQIDMSVQHVSNIENASKKPSLATLMNIAEVLDVTLDDLLAESYIKEKRKDVFYKEMEVILEQCSADEQKVVAATLKTLVESLLERRR